MRKVAILSSIFLAALLAACAGPNGPRGDERPAAFAKNPTVVLALDIAQSREAQEKGLAKALADTAAEQAILFVPNPVQAAEWLKKSGSGLNSQIKWQPHKVYLSCDGKTGVTTGAFQKLDGVGTGFYTAVWQYFEKSRGGGEWRWLLRHSVPLDSPRTAPEFLQTKIASCVGSPTASVVAPAEGVQMKQGFSRDQSLSWAWQYRPDKSRYLSVKIWTGTGLEKAFADKVRAPTAR